MTRGCAYETDRLEIAEWHSFGSSTYDPRRLPADVAAMLTEDVTRPLPPQWHGEYSRVRAASWIEERDGEGVTLLVLEKRTAQPLGLILLFESPSSPEADPEARQIQLRLGYLLAEPAWGRGYASEMLQGLVQWCRARPSIQSLVGGVARDNPASRRVLEKLGFQRTHSTPDEDFLELVLGDA